MKSALFGLLILLLAGCASSEQYAGNLPYPYWRLGFLAPDYMEVWVETADVEDIRGERFFHVGSGIVAVRTPPENQGHAAGWGERVGWGAGRYVNGADMPKRIYVRWQSMAEPQTYRVILDIPERARQLMSEHQNARVFTGSSARWHSQGLGDEHLRQAHRGITRPGGNRAEGSLSWRIEW